jgi:hypothetical protein
MPKKRSDYPAQTKVTLRLDLAAFSAVQKLSNLANRSLNSTLGDLIRNSKEIKQCKKETTKPS